jgi:hypothetical protein
LASTTIKVVVLMTKITMPPTDNTQAEDGSTANKKISGISSVPQPLGNMQNNIHA